MINIGSYLLASSYSAASPLFDTASSACSINGQSVPCDSIINSGMFEGIFGGMATFLFFFLFIWFLFMVVAVIIIVSTWKIYQKAGKPGWASIVPIYNYVILLEIIKKPLWWIILMFIPLVNIVIAFMITYQLAKAFGQDIGFTLGLIFLPFIFYPMLAFGKYTYIGEIPPIDPLVPNSPEPTPTSV